MVVRCHSHQPLLRYIQMQCCQKRILAASFFLAVLSLCADGAAGPTPAASSGKSAAPSSDQSTVLKARGDPSTAVSEGHISEVTLFSLGGGLALLIALLAWGEQIRAIAKDTRDLENDFVRSRGLTRAELLPVLRSQDPTDRLLALTKLMTSGNLKTAPEVEVLSHFRDWGARAGHLTRLLSLKYWLTVGLTVAMFLEGGISVYFDLGPAAAFSASRYLLLLVGPAVLVVGILVALVCAARAEKRLVDLITVIGERV